MKPHIIDIEQKLLGAYIENQDLFIKCQHLVSSNIFTKGVNRSAYSLIKKLHEKNVKPDMAILFSQLKKILPSTECAKISLFVFEYTYSSQPEQYVIILFNNYVANYLMPILYNSHAKLLAETSDSLEVMTAVKDAITNVELVINNVNSDISIEDVFDRTVKRIEDLKNNKIKSMGFTFGLEALDKKTGGLTRGMTVIGAVPGAGKSSLILNIIRHNTIKSDVPTVFFSLEMPSIEIMTNLIAAECEINSFSLRSGNIMDEDMARIKNVKNKLKSNFLLDDKGGITWQYVESKLRDFRKKRKIPIETTILVALDYLQLMGISPEEARGMTEEGKIEKKCNELTRIAKNDNVAFVLLSQLSREVMKRTIPRPIMSDLRGSGAIEACSQLILLMYRPDYHNIFKDDEGRDLTGLCEINPVKARYAQPKAVYARFHGKYSKFSDYEEEGIKTGGEDAF